MTPQQPLFDLIQALDRSQWQLHAHLSRPHPEYEARPLLLRRRRAGATLRAALRYHGLMPPAPVPCGNRPARDLLHDLWHAERRILSLYDTALARAVPGTPEHGLLCEQRADSEEALLDLTQCVRSVRSRPEAPARTNHTLRGLRLA